LGRSFGSGCHPITASIAANPTKYAKTTNHPPLIQANVDLASGKILEIATPADDPNQIIEPPNPTA
jgi:hypothetical protein